MNESAPTVVIIEDEKEIRRFVRLALEEEGCRVHEAQNAAQGRAQVEMLKPALVILDLGLPDRDGVAFTRELREWSTVPIIVLSARSAELEKIEALDAGVDDYLTKPFNVGELRARVRAVLRRQILPVGAVDSVVEFGDVRVDLIRRRVERAGQSVHLTKIEFRLLSILLAHAGKVLTHRQLLKDVWGPSYIDNDHYLRIYVGHLRRKLENDPARPRYLLTETGIGYRFFLDPAPTH